MAKSCLMCFMNVILWYYCIKKWKLKLGIKEEIKEEKLNTRATT